MHRGRWVHRAHPQGVSQDSGWQVTDADSCLLGRRRTTKATDESSPQVSSGTSAPRLQLPHSPLPIIPATAPRWAGHLLDQLPTMPRPLGPPRLSLRRAKGTRGQGCLCLPWVRCSFLGCARGGCVVHLWSSAGENSPQWKQMDPWGWAIFPEEGSPNGRFLHKLSEPVQEPWAWLGRSPAAWGRQVPGVSCGAGWVLAHTSPAPSILSGLQAALSPQP